MSRSVARLGTSRVVNELPPQFQNGKPAKFRKQRMKMNAQRLDAAGYSSHTDADGTVGDTLHLARDLEHIYDEVVEQQFAPAGAFELFETDQRVPPGAKSHTVRRLEFTGEPEVYKSSDAGEPAKGRADVRQDEETFPVRYYVQDIPLDFFDELHSDFAQRQLRQELIDAAQITMERFATEKVWLGDSANGIYGILNYPWLQKRVLPETFTSGADKAAIKDQVLRTEQLIIEKSQTRAIPNRLVTSPRVKNYLSRKDRSSNYQGSLEEIIVNRLTDIDQIEMDPDLKDIGANGEDGMLFFTENRRAISNVVPEPFSMLPIRERGSFDLVIPTYMAHGGVVMRDPWANMLALIDVSL